MKRKLSQNQLFQTIENAIPKLPDFRSPDKRIYSMRNPVFVAFTAFFLHAPSLNQHYNRLNSVAGKVNRKALFKIDKIPCPNQVRNILDAIPSNHFQDIQDEIINKVQRSGVLREFYSDVAQGYLFAIDGVEMFRSENICCPLCCKAEHRDGRTDYFHRLLLGCLIHPTMNLVLPFSEEFIVKQDGTVKEDCERTAVKRLWKDFRKRHPHLKVCVLGDDAFCTQPAIEDIRSKNQNFILSCQPGSHKYLYDWIETLRQGQDLDKRLIKYREGKHFHEALYEYANDVPLKDGENSVRVNFVMVTIKDRTTGLEIGRHAFVTNITLTNGNCEGIASIGRRRWKSENEGNNTLKNQGYHLEHNFGHGKEYLANNFVLLNLIAFLIHQILLFVKQEGYAALRITAKTLKAAIETLVGVFRLIRITCWNCFYRYAVEGIDTS